MSWEAARDHATGYDQQSIRERLVAATERVVESNGQLFERDGVILAQPTPPFALLTFLLRAAARNDGALNVLDFGGSLGSTFRQCSPFLEHVPRLCWNVVEQAALSEVGRTRFSTSRLKFHDSVKDAAREGPPDVVIFSGVLQYLDDPYEVIAEVSASGASTVIIDRNPFSDSVNDVYAVQIVSADIFSARLAFRIFGITRLERALFPIYCKVAEFDCIDRDATLGVLDVRFRGQAFERRTVKPGS
ncbi:methyltransferase, TIGR04325 family [Bradyrhizobium sp. HKCCYLS20291]|uniref:methyltransferase, TIGR04325 family n=1 Tax=Bradyrhizobium sp. HKCCYLS20291 TaxID=3420766 RepID=UPI003EBEB089